MSILFRLLLGKWALNEMQWHGNPSRAERINEKEMKYLPMLILIDLALLITIILTN